MTATGDTTEMGRSGVATPGPACALDILELAETTTPRPSRTSRKRRGWPRVMAQVIGPEPRVILVTGQTARALLALVAAGPKGVTAAEMSCWALRLAAYTHDLRHKHGLVIPTEHEAHDGGWHGRHCLVDAVRTRDTLTRRLQRLEQTTPTAVESKEKRDTRVAAAMAYAMTLPPDERFDYLAGGKTLSERQAAAIRAALMK